MFLTSVPVKHLQVFSFTSTGVRRSLPPADIHGQTANGASTETSTSKGQKGLLIINADDWGRSRSTTDAILGCVAQGAVSSVSAMVFMEDSERAAQTAQERGIDAGLHLNFTTCFSASECDPVLFKCQHEVASYLMRSRFAHTVFHPRLARSFEYLVKRQIEEFHRLYGKDPERIDGHHHMHLCANVVLGGLLPPGTIVRRNFSFLRGEKGFANLLYRKMMDKLLKRKHYLVDYFFKLEPVEPVWRLLQIFRLAQRHIIELETHPAAPEEYKFLAEGKLCRLIGSLPIARGFVRYSIARTPERSL